MSGSIVASKTNPVELSSGDGSESGMQLSDAEVREFSRRLARVEGQVRGLQKMIEERRDCNDVVTQFQAALKALERVGFKMVAAQLFACAKRTDENSIEEFERLQSIFLKLR